MKKRWVTEVKNLTFVFQELKRLTKKLIRRKKGRGRPPKHNPTAYAELIVLKEFKKKDLRSAETDLSKFVVGERVDHSVINYWERKPEIVNCLKIILFRAGYLLDRLLTKEYTFVDSTKFTSWKTKTTEVFVCNRIAKETVYPIGASFLKGSVLAPIKEVVRRGEGELLADAWFDERKTIEFLFKKGYIPLICPNKRRSKGYYRKISRILYKQRREIYRQRGRGESPFGSLTNEFGDRFKAINENCMQARILGRIICYQIKILIRCDDKIISIDVLIIRHAPTTPNFLNQSYLFLLMKRSSRRWKKRLQMRWKWQRKRLRKEKRKRKQRRARSK